MLSNYADTPAAEKITELRPYEAVIYQMEPGDANHGEQQDKIIVLILKPILKLV